jgi:hypothetical protein
VEIDDFEEEDSAMTGSVDEAKSRRRKSTGRLENYDTSCLRSSQGKIQFIPAPDVVRAKMKYSRSLNILYRIFIFNENNYFQLHLTFIQEKESQATVQHLPRSGV